MFSTLMPLAPETLALLAAVASVAGMARGFSGFGAALIFVPLAARLIGPHQASPVLLMADSVVALPLIWSAWEKSRKRDVALMATGALLGVPLGTWILKSGDAVSLRWLIAALTAGMLALLLSGWRYRGQPIQPATIAVGAVSGLFSGIAQIGGPPVVAYWLGQDTRAEVMRASTILFFALGSATTLVSYGAAGLLTVQVAQLSLVVLPFFAVGLYVGSRIFGLASEKVFRRTCLALIAASLVLGLPAWG